MYEYSLYMVFNVVVQFFLVDGWGRDGELCREGIGEKLFKMLI